MKANSLILSKILIQLHVAPCFTTAVDALNGELSCLERPQVKIAKDLGCLIDKIAKGFGARRKREDIGDRQIRGGVAEDQRVGQQLKERAVLDLVWKKTI